MAKLNADQIKELSLNNFEKVIFGIFALFFLMTVFSAAKVKPYDRKPAELTNACETAKGKFNQKQEVQPVVRNYDSLVKSVQEPIPDTDYVTAVAWNPVLFKEGEKRRTPKALGVQNLVVKEWHGSVQKPQQIDEETGRQIMDDGLGGRRGNSTTMGVRCCVILGEIPYLDQEEEFQNKLGVQGNQAERMNGGGGIYGNNPNDPDAPYYHNFVIERAEVPADGNMENLQWVDLHKKGSENEKLILFFNPQSADGSFISNSGGGMDIPEKYRPPQLWRRPSKTDKTAAAEETKTMKKPNSNTGRTRPGVVPEPMGGMENGMSANGLLPARGDTLMANLPQVAQNGQGGYSSFNWATYLPYQKEFKFDVNSMYGTPGMYPGGKKKAKDAEETPQDETGDDDVGDDDDDVDDDVIQPNQMGLDQVDQEAEVRLFRYVDYTVKEGKQYVYRVRLTLHNPNYQHEPAFTLENPEDAKIKLLESPYSDVTHPVSIPLDRHFYVQGFSKFYPRKAVDKKDPRIKKWSHFLTLLPVKYNPDTGNEDFTFFKQLAPSVQPTTKGKKKPGLVKKEEPARILPGQLLDLMVFEDEIRDLGNVESRSYVPNRYDDEDEEEDRDQKRFVTQFVLLDFRGGQMLYEPLDDRDLDGADEQIKKYPEAIYTPASVLLIGPKGELIIQSELEDVVEVYRRRDTNELNDMTMEPMDRMDSEQDRRANRRRRGKNGEEAPPPEPRNSRRNNRLEGRL